MNQLMHITNQPGHRCTYLGEMVLHTCTAYNPGRGTGPFVEAFDCVPASPPRPTAPYIRAFELMLQHFVYSPEEEMGELKHGACRVIYKKGEPYILVLSVNEEADKPGDEFANRDVSRFIREHQADIAFFLGDDLADEIASWMIAGYQAWVKAGKVFRVTHSTWLEFADFTHYNQLFMELCERIAKNDGRPFDREAKTQELVEFWCATEGDFNVPGQRKWYATHGPTKDNETEADYALENEQFEALVSKGQDAVRQLVSV